MSERKSQGRQERSAYSIEKQTQTNPLRLNIYYSAIYVQNWRNKPGGLLKSMSIADGDQGLGAGASGQSNSLMANEAGMSNKTQGLQKCDAPGNDLERVAFEVGAGGVTS